MTHIKNTTDKVHSAVDSLKSVLPCEAETCSTKL
jgi:hypothetical protein